MEQRDGFETSRRQFLAKLGLAIGCAGGQRILGEAAFAEQAAPPSAVKSPPIQGGCSAPAGGSTLRIRITDEAGKPAWARLEVRGLGEKMYQPPDAVRDLTAHLHGAIPFYLGSFVIKGVCELKVPAGDYHIVAEHGLEYEREERAVYVRENAGAQVNIQMRRWISMRKLGWWSADMHIHRLANDAPALAQAEDVNLCPLITMWPHGVKGYAPLHGDQGMPAAQELRVDPDHIVTLRNAEDERQGGAWILQDLRKYLAGLKTATWWFPSALKFITEAREQGPPNGILPWVDYENLIWWQVPAVMPFALPDSVEVLNNHFMQYAFDDDASWGRPYNRKQFRGPEGFVNYSLGLYYRYLNLGFRLPASAGSASGVHPNPVGYNRVYVRLDGPFTIENWYGSLKQGKSFATNGPMLFFKAEKQGSRLSAFVEAHAREPMDRIEIIANGHIVRWFPLLGKRDFKAQFNINPQRFSWIAARCFLEPGVTVRLAHTSPVYLGGTWDAREDAQFFIDWVKDLINDAQGHPRWFGSLQNQQQILDLYHRALAFYQRKLQSGSV